MPELPEVEASRRLLEEHCLGLAITACITTEAGGHARSGEFDDIVFDDPTSSAKHVSDSLVGKTVVGIRRKGKQLWLEMSSPPHLLAHFGMTGAFVVRGVQPLSYQEFKVHDEAWPPRFTKLELALGGAVSLAFCDPRRLGRLRLRDDPPHQEPWSTLAPDALLELPSVGAMSETLARTTSVIKALLLDQNKLISGVGNWVADEVLFHAGIHPEAPCNTLSDRQVGALHGALRDILSVAVGCNAESMAFPPTWLFHYRWGKGANGTKVPGEHGGSISYSTVGGRTSAIVLTRQKKGEKTPAAVSASKAKKAAGRAKAATEPKDDTEEVAGPAAETKAGTAKKQPARGRSAKKAAKEDTDATAATPASVVGKTRKRKASMAEARPSAPEPPEGCSAVQAKKRRGRRAVAA